MFEVGSRIGPYEITGLLRLGPGEAYRAVDHEQRRDVTLQVLRAEFGTDPDRLSRFERDIEPAAALAHPHILEVYDVGIDAHAAYIVSAPVAGETLRERLNARGLTIAEAIRGAIQIAGALRVAHTKNVRHGHLTSDTVVVEPGGRAVVLGFGLDALVPDVRTDDARALGALVATMLRARPRAGAVRSRSAPDPVPRPRWEPLAIAAAAILAITLTLMWDHAAPVGQQAPSAPPARDAAVPPARDAAVPPAPSATDVAAVPEPEPVEVPSAPPRRRTAVEEAEEADLRQKQQRRLAFEPRPAPAPPPPASRANPELAPPPSPPPPPPVAAGPPRPLAPVIADGRDATSLTTEGAVRANEFDLAGAAELLQAAARRGDEGARVAALYVQGLLDAREAFRQGGSSEALKPVRDAIQSLDAIAKARPGAAEIARLTLHAAAAAAQSERDEMTLYLETALEMESLQQVAGLSGAPIVSAAEVAGDLWFQVHRYDEARRAYTAAAERVGSTLRILSGLARTARRLEDPAAACASYQRLLAAWGGRPGLPVEIAEARAYVGGCAA